VINIIIWIRDTGVLQASRRLIVPPSVVEARNAVSPLHVTTKRRMPSPAYGPCRLPDHWG
jgi:hypothetical protein